MIIPHHMLSPEALHSVIEVFVTREGTDYGEHDIPLPTKVLRRSDPLDWPAPGRQGRALPSYRYGRGKTDRARDS